MGKARITGCELNEVKQSMKKQGTSRKKETEPGTLEIRKYPNRRYYDSTRSCHVSLQQIHRLIHEGHNVRVTDAKSGEDITSQILTQILLEYEPVKLDLFSTELLTRAIRVSDRLLHDFVDVYFRQAFEAFCGSQKQLDQVLRQAHQLKSVFPSLSSWGNFLPPWMPQPQAQSQEKAPGHNGGQEKDSSVKDEIGELRREISGLKAQLQKQKPPPRKQRKT
jgi:polyhydroxyalkanoate synthesis repressor PhaR